MCDYNRDMDWILDSLIAYTQFVTVCNYNAITDLHTL
jgi:hypothetical protein